jgi:MFS family permease
MTRRLSASATNRLLRWRSVPADNRRWWTLGAMCFALFMIMLDNTVVNVALPAIQKDLDTSIGGLEWTVNAYTLSFAVLLVTGGRLGDIFGRRRMFLFGVLVFGLSSAFIGFSQTEAWLVAGRTVQGIGAAFMMPATLSIIANAFRRTSAARRSERGPASARWRWRSGRWSAASSSRTSPGSRSSSSTSPSR